MLLLLLSFLAGILTIAAPCVFTLLPVIVGGTVARSGKDKRANFMRPLIIAFSLVASIIIFTLLLRYSTQLLGVSPRIWQIVSGGIIIALGLNFLLKTVWARLLSKIGVEQTANKLLGKAYFKNNFTGDILTGAALGPVFSSCSPTYAFVVASILPVSFSQGLLYLTAYSIGLGGTLLIVAYAGQALATKLGWLANPDGIFRKVMGIVFIVVGVAVLSGLDKKFEASVLSSGLIDGILNLENRLR